MLVYTIFYAVYSMRFMYAVVSVSCMIYVHNPRTPKVTYDYY